MTGKASFPIFLTFAIAVNAQTKNPVKRYADAEPSTSLSWEQKYTIYGHTKENIFKVKSEKVGYYNDGSLRIDHPNSSYSHIVNPSKNAVYLNVDKKVKSYSEMSFESAKISAEEGRSFTRDDIQMALIKRTKPWEVELTNKTVRYLNEVNAGGKNFVVIKTGNKKNINGFNCEENFIKLGDDILVEIWATKDIPLPLDFNKNYYSSLLKAHNEKMVSDNLLVKIESIEGFPVIFKLTLGWLRKSVEVTKVYGGTKFDKKVFEIPAGYKKDKIVSQY
jgi:hypothetical protein